MEFVLLPLARTYDLHDQLKGCLFNDHYIRHSVSINDGPVVQLQRSSSAGLVRPCVRPEAPVTPSRPQQEAAAAGWAPGGAASVA